MPTIKPYVSPDTEMSDMTLKAVCAGILFGIIFGSANAYLGLRVGLTISTAIPLAVVSVAVFRLLKPILGPSTILEHNIAQTTGSASSSLASGIIFTVPALFLWGFSPSLLQIAMLAMLGGILGVLFMIPLRRFLIVKEHGNLPYPEGTASAQVLIAADTGGAKARFVFQGLAMAAFYKALMGFLHLWPETIRVKLPVLSKAEVSLEASPALLGVGYILGFRISAIMVAGGLLSWIALIPLIAHFGSDFQTLVAADIQLNIADMTAKEIWTNFIRYIGAGAVACAGIITVIKSLPTMIESFRIGFEELRNRSGLVPVQKKRTESDLSVKFVLLGVLIVFLVVATTPFVLGISSTWITRIVGAICVVFFAFLFVTVSSRIVGLVGVSSNPTSGMTIVTLLGTSVIFFLLGWTDDIGKATALTIGTVVCVAASIAGDISQDLKTGYLIGATPRKQQTVEIIGALSSASFIAAAVFLLGRAFTFGSPELAAPQATLMKTVIEGVLQADLPWGLILFGASFALVSELLGIPSLPFAVGIYLPLSSMTPLFVGGTIRHFIEKREKDRTEILMQRKEQGILFGSGLIAGEGIMGILIAAYASIFQKLPAGIGLVWPELVGQFVTALVFCFLALFLVHKTKVRSSSNHRQII